LPVSERGPCSMPGTVLGTVVGVVYPGGRVGGIYTGCVYTLGGREAYIQGGIHPPGY